jgi:hypothetical protein
VVAALTAGCCVFALGSLPTAQAAKSNGLTSLSSAPAEPNSTSHGKRAERLAQAEGAPPPTGAVAPPGPPPDPSLAAGHGRHGRVSATAPASPAPGDVAGAGAANANATGSGPRARDRARPAAGHRRRSSGQTSESSESPSAEQQAAVSGEEPSQGVEAFASKQKKGGKGKEKTGKGKEKGGKGKGKNGKGGKETSEEPSEESTAPTTLTGKGKSEETASVTSQETTATAAASPTSGIAPASIVSVAPSVTSVAATPGTHARAASGHKAHRRAAAHKAAGASGAAAAPTALLGGASPQSANPSTTARPTAKRTHAGGSQQPALEKTITRIVGVVPTPIRALIVALIALAIAFGIRSRLSGVRTRRLVRQRGQLLEDVGLLQAALLPVTPPRLGPVSTSAAYRPADGPGAGGDFYDVFALEDGRLAVIVGDVSGHGREALPHTALVRYTVRAYLEAGLSPRKALQTAGSVLDRQMGDSFATVVAAIYHPRERTLTYAGAGHPPPVVLGETVGADGQASVAAIELTTACSAPPLGAGMRTGTRETVVSVPGPARLCFHTDGVTEARVGEDLFGSERLAVTLDELGRQADASGLLDSVAQRTDSRPDDMAACLLRVEDGSGPPAIVHELLELDAGTIASGRAERFLRESGMTAAAAVAAIDSLRPELDRHGSALLELSLGDGAPLMAVEHDDIIRAAALSAVSAS